MSDGRVTVRAERRWTTVRWAALLMATALAAAMPVSQVHPQPGDSVPTEAEQRQFDIPAQPLTEALIQFGRQAELQASADAGIVQTLRSVPVKGSMTWQRALSTILSGTGLTYRRNGSMVTLVQASAEDEDGGPVQLGPITVTAPVEHDSADLPYLTPGSSGYISSEQIQRVPPSSPGDIFREVPGVLSGSNHNGPAIDVSIRGMQGHNRVKVMVEGTQQESSFYRGYAGPDNRTYVDPEMIGGVEIEKGPGSGVYGAGTTAGVVNIRTLNAGDLVREGRRVGVRLRGGLSGNGTPPRPLKTHIYWPRDADTGLRRGTNDILTDENWRGSFAGALKFDHFEFVGAFSRNKQGNYYSGKHGPKTYQWTTDDLRYPLEPGKTRTDTVQYAPRSVSGREVPNTSKDTTSLLFKATGRLDGGHSAEVGVLDYESKFGQVWPSLVRLYAPQQWALTEVKSTRYWGKYKWGPDNDLIDLQANVWTALSDEAEGRLLDTNSWGVEAWNTSRFETPIGGLSLGYGGSHTSSSLAVARGTSADGTRRVTGGYVDASLAPTDWLTLDVGLRYDSFDSDGYSWRRECDWSKNPPCKEVQREGKLKDSSVQPSFGVTLSPVDGIQLFGKYSKGWRPPSIVETSGAGPSGNFEYNPDLKPERLESVEFGVNVLRDGVFREDDAFRAKLVFFDNQHADYVVRGYKPGTDILQFTNIPKAKMRGIEASTSYDAGFFFANLGFNYFTNVEYCYDRWIWKVVPSGPGYALAPELIPGCHAVTSATDWQNTYVPPKSSGSATLGVRLFDESLVLGGRVNFHEKAALPLPSQGGLNFQVRWPSARIIDLFGSYEFNEHLTASFSVENLTNRFYVSPLAVAQIPSPGRTARATVTLRF